MRVCKPCGPAAFRHDPVASVPGHLVGRNALVGPVIVQSQAVAIAEAALASGDLDRICLAARDLWRAGYLDLGRALEAEAQAGGFACRIGAPFR